MSSSTKPHPFSLLIWRLVASSGKAWTREQIMDHPSVREGRSVHHTSPLQRLDWLLYRSHLTSDAPTAAESEMFWFGRTCINPHGEPAYPRHLTEADNAIPARRTRVECVDTPLQRRPYVRDDGNALIGSRRGSVVVFPARA